MTPHQVITNFLIEARLATQASPEQDCVIYTEREMTYIRYEGEEPSSSIEQISTLVGTIWNATHTGGLDRSALEQARLNTQEVLQFIYYCRGVTYAQCRVLGRTIKRQSGFDYMDIGWGNILDFTAEETLSYKGTLIFKLHSKGGRVT
ncbi:hypothetical protein KBC54_01910 [Patescibacteria group bacterium]|nr:hypothetical protein [Patescibacteria group bacterium]